MTMTVMRLTSKVLNRLSFLPANTVGHREATFKQDSQTSVQVQSQ